MSAFQERIWREIGRDLELVACTRMQQFGDRGDGDASNVADGASRAP